MPTPNLSADVEVFVAYFSATVPPDVLDNPTFTPDGYDDLVSCVLDAVGSVGVRYQNVERGLARFRRYVAEHELGPVETPTQFLETFADHLDDGGQWFAETWWNRQRTSTRSGILKTAAMQRVFEILVDSGIETTAQLVARVDDEALLAALERVPGQSRHVSIGYLSMLAGYRDGVKDDRMVEAFFVERLGRSIPSTEKIAIFVAVAERLQGQFPGITAFHLDHVAWLIQSRRWTPPMR